MQLRKLKLILSLLSLPLSNIIMEHDFTHMTLPKYAELLQIIRQRVQDDSSGSMLVKGGSNMTS